MQLSTPYFQPYFDIDIDKTEIISLNNNYEPKDLFKLYRYLELTLNQLDIVTNIETHAVEISGGQKTYIIIKVEEQI